MPASETQSARRLSLPPLGWTAAIVTGVLLVAMVALLAATLAVLQDSRRHIEAQDGKAQLALDQARRSGREAKPVLRDARPLISEAREAVGPLSESTGQISTAAQSLPELARTGQAVAERSIPLLEALGRTDLATLLHNGNIALAELASPDFLRDLRRGAQVPPRIETLMRRLLRAQLAALEVQRQSLAVQRQTLEAANSIDRKTGGRPPAVAPAAP